MCVESVDTSRILRKHSDCRMATKVAESSYRTLGGSKPSAAIPYLFPKSHSVQVMPAGLSRSASCSNKTEQSWEWSLLWGRDAVRFPEEGLLEKGCQTLRQKGFMAKPRADGYGIPT